jgi:hypothetical protein
MIERNTTSIDRNAKDAPMLCLGEPKLAQASMILARESKGKCVPPEYGDDE